MLKKAVKQKKLLRKPILASRSNRFTDGAARVAIVRFLSKKVLLSYKKFIVCMNFEDTDTRIQTFISSNRLYEQERFRYSL